MNCRCGNAWTFIFKDEKKEDVFYCFNCGSIKYNGETGYHILIPEYIRNKA